MAAALFVLALPVGPARSGPQRELSAGLHVRIRVSRRELRAEFRVDTTHRWGWPTHRDDRYLPRYAWMVKVEGMDGPQWLGVLLEAETVGGRNFSSLTRLVRAGRTVQCSPGMMIQCAELGMRATVKGDVVVLVLRDSARIFRLFGMRPRVVQAWEERPDTAVSSLDSVGVEYVDPPIPEPDAATRTEAARSLRRHEASITTISRFIDGQGEHGRALWVVVGDSIPVRVSESHCTYDACTVGPHSATTDSGWSVADTSIARLQPVFRDTTSRHRYLGFLRARWYLKALRPGRTLIAVRGIHSPSDSAPSSEPPAHEIRREVIVTLPLGRVELTPRPNSVVVRRQLDITARVFDTAGQSLGDVPVTIEVQDGSRYSTLSLVPIAIDMSLTGPTRIIARVGPLTDTLTVTILDSSAVPKR